MAVNFNGLASGLDSGALIDQLVNAEKASARLLEKKVANLDRQGNIVDDLVSKLRILGDRARGLDVASELRAVKVDRSDPTHAGVAVSATASPSSHTLRVATTATAQTVTSRSFTSDAAGALGAGQVTMQTAGGTPVTVAWTAADSLSAIATRINDAGGPVAASVLHDGTGYRLIASARATGTAAAASFTESGDPLGWSVPANTTAPARDASFVLDGIPLTRGSNVVADALPGVTLSLIAAHGASEPDTTITVAVDPEAITSKVKGLVDVYNTVQSALDAQLRYNGTTKGADTLFGDGTLRQLQGALGKLVTSEHGGKTLAGIGVSIASSGRLTVDETKLSKAIASDPGAVEKLFVTGGFAPTLASFTDQYTRSGDGILAIKNKGIDDRTASYKKDITRIEDAATKLGDRLRAQFTAMERAISTMQSQGQRLAQILGS